MYAVILFFEESDAYGTVSRSYTGKVIVPFTGFKPNKGEIWLCRLEDIGKCFIAHPVYKIR